MNDIDDPFAMTRDPMLQWLEAHARADDARRRRLLDLLERAFDRAMTVTFYTGAIMMMIAFWAIVAAFAIDAALSAHTLLTN